MRKTPVICTKLNYKGENMSIKNIKRNEKLKVLIRLIKSNETFEDACSKSGLSKTDANTLLAVK
jgi:hypothetical protein